VTHANPKREDFYLLLLTKLKDESDNCSDLQARCIDIQDAIEHYNVPDTSSTVFDQIVHIVDEHAHEQYYETIKTEMHLDLVDDESVQDHVLRILNNHQYTGVLTLAALSTVI